MPRESSPRSSPDHALLPVREGDVIPVVAAAPYDVGIHHWQITPPEDQLVVIVKGSYDIVPDGPVTPRETANFITGERSYGDEPSASAVYPDDLAIFKLRADVVMVGHAYPPKPHAVATQVAFSFGSRGNRFERTINVFGDRVWRRGLASAAGDPQPFEKIPLVYERAFGGPELASNPVGRGYRDSALMPNLELPDTPVTRPDHPYPPACFAPLAFEWPARWSKMGTYDRSWLKTRWPYFPADFDWSFFQAAPVEQRLDYLRGDEPFEARGVHREWPVIRGRLAGERARALVLTRKTPPQLLEVALHLDTVAFNFDTMVVDVIWRGRFAVTAKDAPEVRAIFALREPLSEQPQSQDAVWQLLLDTLREPVEEEPPTDADEPVPGPTDEQQRERAEKLAELEEQTRKFEQQAEEALAKADLPADALAGEPPPPKLDDMAAAMRDAGATPAEVAAVLEALSPAPEEAEGDPTEPAPLRERVIAMLHARESFARFDFEQADLSDLDFSGCELTGARLQRATFQRANFAGAMLAEAELGNGDFTAACFDGANLTGADLTAATLTRASFREAQLSAAELSDAVGREASFARASGEGIFFTGGDWQQANFDEVEMPAASFTGAELGGASFRRAKLAKINLRDASGPDVCFEWAHLHAIRGDGCQLHRANLHGVEAPRSVFENADLTEADLSDANLQSTSLLRARCLRADFARSELQKSNLARAQLTGANFQRANLMMACLDDADLGLADLRGCNLHGCSLIGTELQDAKLRGAITTKSSLVMKPFIL